MGFIYKITNTINSKAYIGVTKRNDAIQRYKQHIYAIYYGNGCPLLGDAVKKYGKEAFKFEVIIICFNEDIYKYEQSYINKYNTMVPNGYNVQEGGKLVCSFKGRTHSEENKELFRKNAKEFHNRPEIKEMHRQQAIEINARINMGEILRKSEKWQKAVAEGRIGNRGGKHNLESNKKISESLKLYYKNNKHSENDSKKKISDLMRRLRGRKISKFSKENVFIASYDSIMEASEKNNINRRSIQATAAGRTQTGGSYIWKYTDI